MLGDNIRKYRIIKGLTQQELADSLHIVRQTVSKWEKNLSVPDAVLLKNTAGCLEVSVACLLGEDESKLPDENISIKLSEINEALSSEIKKRRKSTGIIALVAAVLIVISACFAGLYAAYLNPMIRYSISKPVDPSAEVVIEKVHLIYAARFALPMPPHIRDEIATFGACMEALNDEVRSSFTAPINITAEASYRGNTTVFVFTGTGIKDGKQTEYRREIKFDGKIRAAE